MIDNTSPAQSDCDWQSAVLSVEQIRDTDQRAIQSGISAYTLLCNAGQAVAEEVDKLHTPDGAILCVCGNGNNGGDGLVAARLLAEKGYRVDVALAADKTTYQAEAARALAELPFETLSLDNIVADGYSLIIDALLGAGLNRPITGRYADAVAKINASSAQVVSIDVPSGIHGNRHDVPDISIKARLTVTFVCLKPAHLLFPSREHCGDIVVRQIGIPPDALPEDYNQIRQNHPDHWLAALPKPDKLSHKYQRGHCLVASGPLISTGAARLAARAALRCGAGAVTLASPRDALAVNASHLTAEMLTQAESADELATLIKTRRTRSVIIGPGFGTGPKTRDFVLTALEHADCVVLDADALTVFAANPTELFDQIRKTRCGVVMTPHAGEFDRLFSGLGELKSLECENKIERTRAAARLSQAIIVYKGPDSVIAAPNGSTAVNVHATPWLATAGAGDVLAGTIGGLVAQQMPLFDAAMAACWLHGEAGLRLGPGLIATDIAEQYPAIFRSLYH